jgi:hypothetical protein
MGSERSERLNYHIGRVTYSPAEQAALLDPLFSATKCVLDRYTRQYGYDVRDVAVQMLSAKLCSHLVHHSIALKNEEWGVEQEWRTVFSLLINDSDERKARVALRSDGRPFVDVRIRSTEPDEDRMPVVRVTAGVHADTQAIRDTLDRFGYQHVAVARHDYGIRTREQFARGSAKVPLSG